METRIDALGEMCPIPILKVIDRLPGSDKIVLVTDHSCTKTNIEDYFRQLPYLIDSVEVMNGIWEITITKEALVYEEKLTPYADII
jgi:TusA-related sulfurtransferase